MISNIVWSTRNPASRGLILEFTAEPMNTSQQLSDVMSFVPLISYQKVSEVGDASTLNLGIIEMYIQETSRLQIFETVSILEWGNIFIHGNVDLFVDLTIHLWRPRLDAHLLELGPNIIPKFRALSKNTTPIILWLIHLKWVLLD